MAKFQCNLVSYTLQRTVDVTVIIPTPTIPDRLNNDPRRHTPKEKYPVLYLLHGMGGNHSSWPGYSNVEMYAEERQIAVVTFSGENKSYVKVGNDDFFTFVSEELPDFVCGMFPVSDKPEHTYIAGLSMGGYGTYVHALNFPERFCAFGAFSAATRLNSANTGGPDAVVPDEYCPDKLAEKIAAAGKKFPKAYIACGAKDSLFENNKELRDKLKKLGADVTWVEHPDYGHEWRFWNWQIEEFLKWIPRTDAYRKELRAV